MWEVLLLEGGHGECNSAAGTAEVIDELLWLVPEHDPPAGFESSVLARLTATAQRRRSRLRLLWAASIVAVAVLTASAVWWRTADDRELAGNYRHTLAVAHGHDLSAAPLLFAGGAETGTVFAYDGSPSWIYVTFRSAPPQGNYDVRLLTRDGRRLALRPFTARPGGTAWGSTTTVPIRTDREARIHQVQGPDNDRELRMSASIRTQQDRDETAALPQRSQCQQQTPAAVEQVAGDNWTRRAAGGAAAGLSWISRVLPRTMTQRRVGWY